MGLNLSIKDVPADVAERLRQRAARNHRSLQGELMAIVTEAVASQAPPVPQQQGHAGGRMQGWKTVEQLVAERRASGWAPHPSLAGAPLGVDIVRADRDSR
jgi:antitoxin FitA